MYGGQSSHIPIKINQAGVIPVIFASSITLFPATLASFFPNSSVATWIANVFAWGKPLSTVLYIVLILAFTYFYTAITFNPVDVANNMKKYGGFVPGIKPGAPTADFIDNIISRITLPGSILLSVVAIMPAFAILAGVGGEFAQFYGGTSLLIMVGVIMDTLRQIESYLLMRHYEGMMKSGNMKNDPSNYAVA